MKWQLRVRHKLLSKPFFHTFGSEAEARSYGEQLEALLARGIVPVELLEPEAKRDSPTFAAVIAEYLRVASPAPSDIPLLTQLHGQLGMVRVRDVTIQWVEQFIHALKVDAYLAPGTIRKRVESLGRALAWHLRRVTPNGEHPPANPFRLMPRGYSVYTEHEKAVLAKDGKEVRHDKARDRRLSPTEEVAVQQVLAGEKRADRERRFTEDPLFPVLYHLILHTGMRLSEAYRLRVEQVDLKRFIFHVEGSKGHRGKLKPRMVPMVHVLRPMLAEVVQGRDVSELVFPYWDGTAEGKPGASSRLSQRFAGLFRYADVPGFTEHDLRHEATCRWFEMRSPQGGWLFSDIEVCRIMGWTDTRMALRYASLRGEDLAARLG